MGDCHYKSGDVIYVSDKEAMGKVLSKECTLSEGVKFVFYYDDTEEKPEVTQKTKELKKMPETNKAEPSATAPEASTVVEEKETKQDTTKQTEATTSVPDAPFDVNQILQSTGGGAGVAIILAIVAVVGGGAAFKFYKQFAEQKHEQKMKQLEIQAQQQGMNGAQPPPCQAQNTIIEGRLAAMEAKLATVEKKSSSFSADFDADELENRVLKIEKKIKTLSKKETI